MSSFIFPDISLVIIFLLTYIFHHSSITSLPWSWLVSDAVQSPTSLMLENYSVWLSLYSLAHLILYVEPQRSIFHPFKLNPNYPSYKLIGKEFLRSARGVAIGTIWEVTVYQLHETANLPSKYAWHIFKLSEEGDLALIPLLLSILTIYCGGDFHFYWTHRLLHTPWLYKTVHKVHHESINPDSWPLHALG